MISFHLLPTKSNTRTKALSNFHFSSTTACHNRDNSHVDGGKGGEKRTSTAQNTISVHHNNDIERMSCCMCRCSDGMRNAIVEHKAVRKAPIYRYAVLCTVVGWWKRCDWQDRPFIQTQIAREADVTFQPLMHPAAVGSNTLLSCIGSLNVSVE